MNDQTIQKSLKISVVIAAYNGERFIGEQLRSLAEQTRPPDEILIGDDSPSAATRAAIDLAIIQQRAKRGLFPEWRIFANSPRLGVKKNFENLLNHATGDLIFLCDQDDFWLPQKIEKFIAAFTVNPHAVVVACDSLRGDAELKNFGDSLLPRDRAARITEQINRGEAFALVNHYLFAYGHNLAVRREFIRQILPAPENYNGVDKWIRNTATFGEKFHFINEPLTHYRVHPANVSNLGMRGFPVSLWTRWRQICAQSNAERQREIAAICAEFATLKNFVPVLAARMWIDEKIHARNQKLLANYQDYYALRVEMLNLPRGQRWRLLSKNFRRYFSVGNGWKSLLSDLCAGG